MKSAFLFVLIPAVLLVGAARPEAHAQSVPETRQISQVSLTAIAESFITRLGDQQFESAVADYNVSFQGVNDVNTRSVQTYWNDIVAESGPFQRIIRSNVISDGRPDGESVVSVNCQFGRTNRELFVVLSGTDVASFSPVE
ncbi:MAG: hypothetical protein OHK0035_16590 [Cyanobacteria bacterium J069]